MRRGVLPLPIRLSFRLAFIIEHDSLYKRENLSFQFAKLGILNLHKMKILAPEVRGLLLSTQLWSPYDIPLLFLDQT